ILSLQPGQDYGVGSGRRATVTIQDDPVQLLVLDANTATVLSPKAPAQDFSTWGVDLRAQVAGAGVAANGYNWDLTSASADIVSPSVQGQGSYHLQFTWGSFMGSPHAETIILTVNLVDGTSLTQPLRFLVSGTDSPAWVNQASRPTTFGTW